MESYEKVTIRYKRVWCINLCSLCRISTGTRSSTDEGVYVGEVVSDTAAEKAGIKSGDIIVKIGDTKLASMSDFN